jgi:hypothetical protein
VNRARLVTFVAAAAGTALVALGALLDPTRAAFAYLAACVYVLTIAVGALFWVMIGQVTGALWILPWRRLGESLALAVFPLAVLLLPLVFVAARLYPWAGESHQIPEHLQGYYTIGAFLGRSVVCFLVFWAFAFALFRLSIAEDRRPAQRHAARRTLLSGVGLPALALALSLLAFDWLMPLDPEWRSTMYGVYVFAGSALSSLAFLIVSGHAARGLGWLPPEVGVAHDFAAAKLLLTFVLFWAYIGFAQFLIVWMADIPHESVWYVRRSSGGWQWLSGALVIGHFALPFLVLLSNPLKKRPRLVALLCSWILLVHYLDVYWLVLPGLGAPGLGFVWLDLAALLQVGGVCATFVLFWSSPERLLPASDPRLAESLALTPVEP